MHILSRPIYPPINRGWIPLILYRNSYTFQDYTVWEDLIGRFRCNAIEMLDKPLHRNMFVHGHPKHDWRLVQVIYIYGRI